MTLDTRAGSSSDHLGSPEGPTSRDLLSFGGISAKAGKDVSGHGAEASVFSPFAGVHLGDECAQQANTTKESSRITPRLNAQTLFAFGADAFSSAFSDAKQGRASAETPASDKVAVNPWMLAQSELSGSKVANHTSAFNQNFSSETADNNTLQPFVLSKCPKKDLFSSLIDSSTEDIFNNGLSSIDRTKENFSVKQGRAHSPPATNNYTATFTNNTT